MSRKKIVFCVLLSLLISTGHAEQSSEDAANSDAEVELMDADQNGKPVEVKKNTSQNQLADVEKRYGETAATLKKLRTQVQQKTQDLDKTQKAIETYKEEIIRQNKGLVNQIRAAYAMGKKDKLKLLFNQQDPTVSNRMMVYYDYLYKARLKKLAEMEDSLKHLDQLNKRSLTEAELLEKNKELLKAEQIALGNVKKKRDDLLANSKDELAANESRSTEVESKLSNLVASTPVQEHRAADEDQQTLSPTDDNKAQVNGSFSKLKGKLPWPVKGTLAQKFGSAQSGRVWDGVLISAREGTEIHAVNDGKVVYAQWLRGYGLLTIIDHGAGYMSLYAFNQSIYKQVGESVKTGEVIASVGESGGRSQPGLYFGIRKQGVAVNPLEWFKK